MFDCFYYLIIFDYFPLFLHVLITLIKLIFWLKFFPRKRQAEDMGAGAGERTAGSCLVSGPLRLSQDHVHSCVACTLHRVPGGGEQEAEVQSVLCLPCQTVGIIYFILLLSKFRFFN